MIGKLLRGHYQVVSFLGGGGSGETYIAVDTDRPGEPQCVVKLLKPASNDPGFLPIAKRLFKREAETLEQLGKHDQIPRLLAYFEEENEFYLVQDYIKGQPLSVELPAGRRWSEMKVIRLLEDVLRILEFVHGHGTVHRDIKPANLIRRYEDGKIILIDFGAVKQVSQNPQAQTHVNLTTISIGTQGYMPSEQVRGKPRPSSDIYSLGMIGIQALTGIDPIYLEEDRDGEVIWKQYADVSDELAILLTKMVRYHFRDRYESAAEALAALKPLIDQRWLEQPDSRDRQADYQIEQDHANADRNEPGQNLNRPELRETKIADDAEDDRLTDKLANSGSELLELRKTKIADEDEDRLPGKHTVSGQGEPRKTKIADEDDDRLSHANAASGRAISEFRKTKIADAGEDRLSNTGTTAGQSTEPRKTRIVDDENQSPDLAAAGRPMPESRQTRIVDHEADQPFPENLERTGEAAEANSIADALGSGNLTKKKSDRHQRKQLAIGLSIGGIASAMISAIVWTALNSGKLPGLVVQSPAPAPSESANASAVLKGDYTRLEQYLQQPEPNWKAADQETYEVILKLAGSQSLKSGTLDLNEWKNISCEEIKKIDSLWREASGGRLGFGAQLRIFRQTAKEITGKNLEEIVEDQAAIGKIGASYYKKIGWQFSSGDWKVQWKPNKNKNRYEYVSGKEPDFKNPPPGHLPAILVWSNDNNSQGDYRFQKFTVCNL